MSLGVEWQIMCGGIDATSHMNDYIEAIECSGHAGGKSDDARLTFNNKGGRLMAPPKNTPVTIIIEGRTRFQGYTDAPESVVTRGGGRLLEIACSAMDKTSKIKQGMHLYKDDASLKDFLEEAAKAAGVSITVDKSFADFQKPYWSTYGRDFLRLGQMLADDLGATFKIRGNKAVFAARGDGAAPGGGTTPTIYATAGVNLIECRIRPYEGRDRYAKARVRRYDRKKAKWLYEDVEIGDVPGKSDVRDLLDEDRPDQESAKRSAKGRKTDSEREGGSGSCTILYDPDVEVEGACIVEGVDGSSDGEYRIESWRDVIRRNTKAEQELELKQPKAKSEAEEE